MHENDLATRVIGLSIEIHRALGPGLLESAYQECLFYKIIHSGLAAEKQKPMPLIFEQVHLECGYRIDILVENELILEVKSVDAIHLIHLAQTLTYLRLGDYRLGLLINFNVEVLKNGIKRVINGDLYYIHFQWIYVCRIWESLCLRTNLTRRHRAKNIEDAIRSGRARGAPCVFSLCTLCFAFA